MKLLKPKDENVIFSLVSYDDPIKIEYESGKKAKTFFKNGRSSCIACAKCRNPRCIYFSETEITLKNNLLKNFPQDFNNECCPVGAIKFSKEDKKYYIDSSLCINCGVCAHRCPFGCIYFDGKSFAINNEHNLDLSESHRMNEEDAVYEFSKCSKTGCLLRENDQVFETLSKSIYKLGFHSQNLLCRNLLIELNCPCYLSRTGDVYMRMDAIYTNFGNVAPAEFEFKSDSLDAARAVLDDIAVLNGRFGITQRYLSPIVILLTLSNKRQGYWQAVKDIKNVTGIQINTVSVGVLELLLWNFKDLPIANNEFYIDFDNVNLKDVSERIIGRKIDIIEDLTGNFEPQK